MRSSRLVSLRFFFLIHPPPTEIYTLSLHDALPISQRAHVVDESGARGARSVHDLGLAGIDRDDRGRGCAQPLDRSEEHTSELQSQSNLVCRLLLEKKKKQ